MSHLKKKCISFRLVVCEFARLHYVSHYSTIMWAVKQSEDFLNFNISRFRIYINAYFLPYKYYKGTGNCQLYFWCCFLKHRLHKLYYCQNGSLEHPLVKYILEFDVNTGWTHYTRVIWVLQNTTSSQALHCKTSILRAVLKVYIDIQAIYEQAK